MDVNVLKANRELRGCFHNLIRAMDPYRCWKKKVVLVDSAGRATIVEVDYVGGKAYIRSPEEEDPEEMERGG